MFPIPRNESLRLISEKAADDVRFRRFHIGNYPKTYVSRNRYSSLYLDADMMKKFPKYGIGLVGSFESFGRPSPNEIRIPISLSDQFTNSEIVGVSVLLSRRNEDRYRIVSIFGELENKNGLIVEKTVTYANERKKIHPACRISKVSVSEAGVYKSLGKDHLCYDKAIVLELVGTPTSMEYLVRNSANHLSKSLYESDRPEDFFLDYTFPIVSDNIKKFKPASSSA